jgi:hypothetical protein
MAVTILHCTVKANEKGKKQFIVFMEMTPGVVIIVYNRGQHKKL